MTCIDDEGAVVFKTETLVDAPNNTDDWAAVFFDESDEWVGIPVSYIDAEDGRFHVPFTDVLTWFLDETDPGFNEWAVHHM